MDELHACVTKCKIVNLSMLGPICSMASNFMGMVTYVKTIYTFKVENLTINGPISFKASKVMGLVMDYINNKYIPEKVTRNYVND